jgi:hypothetical protein
LHEGGVAELIIYNAVLQCTTIHLRCDLICVMNSRFTSLMVCMMPMEIFDYMFFRYKIVCFMLITHNYYVTDRNILCCSLRAQ